MSKGKSLTKRLEEGTETNHAAFSFFNSIPMVIAGLVVACVFIIGFVSMNLGNVIGAGAADTWVGANQVVTGFNERVDEIQTSGEDMPIAEAWEGSSLRQTIQSATGALQRAMNAAGQSSVPTVNDEPAATEPVSGGGLPATEVPLPTLPAPVATKDPAVVQAIVQAMTEFYVTGDYGKAETVLKNIQLTPGVSYPEWEEAYKEVMAFKADLDRVLSDYKKLYEPISSLSERVKQAQEYSALVEGFASYMQSHNMNNWVAQQAVETARGIINEVDKAAKAYNTAQSNWEAGDAVAAAQSLQTGFSGTTWTIVSWKDVVISLSGENGVAQIRCTTPGLLEGIIIEVPTDLLKEAFPDSWLGLPGDKVGKTLTFGEQ